MQQKPDISHYDGPRPPRPQEWQDVLEFSRSIFFPDADTYREGSRSWPMSLHPDQRDRSLAIFDNGRPISAVQRLERDILIHGHRLRLGFIGGVCTAAEKRGQGLASRILALILDQFSQNDVDFVYISGTHGLYYGLGADHAAIEESFMVRREALQLDLPPVSLRSATENDVAALVSLAQGEGVRFLRPRRDFELVLENGYCSGKRCAFHLVHFRALPVGYLLLSPAVDPSEEGSEQRVLEFAGDRLCLLAGLKQLLDHTSSTVKIGVPHGDRLADLLRSLGLQSNLARSGGTIKAINFARTMAKLQPYFRERLASFPASLDAASGNGRYVAWAEGGSLQIEGEGNVLRTLLGRYSGATDSEIVATGPFRELLATLLPLPLPSLHLNTI